MIVSSYNNQALDDILMIQLSPKTTKQPVVKSFEHLAVIMDEGEVLGLNIFNASEFFEGLRDGPVTLDEKQVALINQWLEDAQIDLKLTADLSPKFVIGHVQECVPHEDSDHLNITQTEVNDGEVLQIVCGASNIAEGQKVVVAKVGAIMPDGLVIWPGELRGVNSEGMICSAKELGLPEEFHNKGIMVLDENAETGSVFELTGLV